MWTETRYMQGCLHGVPPPNPARTQAPVILLGRFMDSVYVAFCGVPQPVFDEFATFIRIFLDTLYQIPMKWEPHGSVNDWCGCRIVTDPDLTLLMKGIHFKLPDAANPAPDYTGWMLPLPMPPHC